MSLKSPDRPQARRASHTLLFAALGDKTRLALVTRLCAGQPASIAQLTSGTHLTRQAVTKHLRVLQRAGMVHSTRSGREALFSLNPEPMQQMQDYLNRVSRQWDHALARLKSFVER
ncbi:MAG: ArsR/SmtB family transcription factor [Terracidiphilus sp.]